MARDWHWRRGSNPKPSSTSNMSKRTSAQTSVSGCIGAVFRLFGPHWPLNYQSSRGRSSSSSSCPKPQYFLSRHTTIAQCIAGEEAPRNNLELVEEASASTSVSLTSTRKDEKTLDIPMGLEIKTSGGDTRSILNDTPRTNTPTLVARLMGLDLLPETDSPSFRTQAKSRSSHHIRGGTRSLPETPRTSSARRSDVDHHHRHRLSLNIENISASEKLAMSRLSSLMKRRELKHDEYEMVKKQVTQSVTRRVGMNITNAYSNREEHAGHFKCKRIDDSNSCIVKHATHSSSKFLASTRTKPSPRIRHKLQAVEEERDEQQKLEPRAKSKCKKGSNKKFISRLKRPQQASEINRSKKEEPFIRPSTANRASTLEKKCRKTPLSNDLVLVKKYPSPQTTKIPQKQVLDVQRPKQSSKTLDRHSYAASATTIPTADDEAAYEYITRILRYSGINKDTQVSLFSPSRPLDPSIFNYLEHLTTHSTNDDKTKCGQLRHRCNRMLLFHMVNELLAEILKPRVISVIVVHGFNYMHGSQLLDMLCSKIRSFPRADCRVLEDIDALIGRDLADAKLESVMVYEEEGEGIVAEIEKDILESLIHEISEA